MKNQIKRARMFFQKAEKGVTELNQASRWPVRFEVRMLSEANKMFFMSPPTPPSYTFFILLTGKEKEKKLISFFG